MSDTPSRPAATRFVRAALAAALAVGLTMALGACSSGEDVVVPTAGEGEVSRLSSAQGKALIASDRRALVIDVRPVEEYRSGHLVGAQSIDATDAEAWEFRTEVLDGDRPTIVYCSAASCSASAAQMLVDAGFTEVYDMGGIDEWDPSELKVEGPSTDQPLPDAAQ